MNLWNFSHNVLGIDVYAFLSIVIMLVMIVVGVWFFMSQRRRDEKHEEELCQLKAELAEVRDLENDGMEIV